MNSSGEAMADRASVTKAKDGRGGFFAVDRRAWHMVCNLGLNTAVAYLVAARGTGGDNRTTKWSTNAIEQRTNISRSRAKAAIHALEAAGLLHRDPASKPSFPKYKLVPAHEVPGCEGCRPPALAGEHARVHSALGTDWTEVPKSAASGSAYARWGSLAPRRTADELVRSGHLEVWTGGRHFRAVRYDAEAAAQPDWIWLPNALVDGAAQETPPAEMARQTGNVLVLRLLVNLYGSQTLDEDGGIRFRRIRQQYARHKVGERGPFVVWGFVPEQTAAFRDAPFVAPHFAAANDDVKRTAAWAEFWKCWNHLLDMGLVEFVAHLVEADTPEGEIIHPVALPGTGLEVERELARAATFAAAALTTPGQQGWALDQGMRLLVPVERRKESVQVMGIARLRYRPRTSRTLAFVARETDWREALDRLLEIAAAQELATSRRYQGDIKGDQGGIKDILDPCTGTPLACGERARSRLDGESADARTKADTMIQFPGAMFNAEGASLNATIPDLTEGTLVEYPHRSMVARGSAAPVGQVWLLADDATFAAVHPMILAEAVKLVLAGQGIVILARRLEPAVDVRDGLLDTLDGLGPGDAG